MPETSNERQARYNLMLAQALGLVRQEDNRITGFAEVKFTYREKADRLRQNRGAGDNLAGGGRLPANGPEPADSGTAG